MRRITPRRLEEYCATLQGPRGHSGLRQRHGGLRAFLRFCADKGWVERWMVGRVPSASERHFDAADLTRIHAGTAALVWRSAFRVLDGLPARLRRFLEEFGSWLRVERGLTPGSVKAHLRSVRAFLIWLRGERAVLSTLRSLTARDVEQFFVEYGQARGRGAQRCTQRGLRHVLRFCAERRLIDSRLVGAVPTLRVYRLAKVPKGLSDDQIAQDLAATTDNVAGGARDRAILLLLATYGVRRGHILGLRLCDLDWERRLIRFAAHKGGKPVTHVLTSTVAGALAHYLARFRPDVPFEEVFLQARPPCVPLKPASLSEAVRQRLARAGVSGGPHAFRHAFATRLLQAGQPIKAIADLLGHRCLSSATIYAKVDLAGLRQVALEWPDAPC